MKILLLEEMLVLFVQVLMYINVCLVFLILNIHNYNTQKKKKKKKKKNK